MGAALPRKSDPATATLTQTHRAPLWPLIALLAVAGCGGGSTSTSDTDEDGFSPADGDCDDLEASVFPGAEEVCDALDNNCDGEVDEGFDGDADGFVACSPSRSAIITRADCDDTDASVNPDAVEVWGDDIDQDCDGIATADLYVSLDCPSCPAGTVYESIQGALDAAVDGQVVAVDSGDWAGGLTFGGKSLKLIAMGGNTLVTLKAPAEGSTLVFNGGEGSSAWVKDFTIEGGTGSLASTCGQDDSLRHGGALCIQGSSPTFIGNVIREGRAGFGGGVYLGRSTATFEANAIRSNSASFGGGMYSFESSPELRKNAFEDNSASADGGGIYAYGGRPRIRSSLIGGNDANRGGGLFFYRSDAYVEDDRIQGNAASNRGGGAYLFDSDARFDRVLFEDNAALEGAGAFFYDGEAELNNVIFKENAASGVGGGLYLYLSADALLRNITWVANSATRGGGLVVDAAAPEITMNLFALNEGDEGGNVYVSGGAPEVSYNYFTAARSAGDPFGVFDPTKASEAEAGVVGISFGAGALTGNAEFVNGPGDGDTDDDDYRLLTTARAIDAGVPADEDRYDPDDTRPDIGAFGGPDAHRWDLDGDGSTAPWSPDFNPLSDVADCDDLDDALYPGQGC